MIKIVVFRHVINCPSTLWKLSKENIAVRFVVYKLPVNP